MPLTLLPLAAALALSPGPYPPAAPPDSIARLGDLFGLARTAPGVTCRQFASTDPSGRGDDHGHFLRLDGKRAVLAECDGPGVVARLWSANAAGRLRVFLDGEETPRLDCPFPDLFTGKVPPFVEPIATHQGGGWISYFPIPFAKSCRVEVDDLADPGALYYQVQVLQYPKGTPIRTFTRELPADEKAALDRALALWRAPGTNPAGTSPDDRRIEKSEVIPGDAAIELPPIPGPAAIVELRVKPKLKRPQVARQLKLVLEFDDAKGQCVLAPVGDFFGVGFGPKRYRGLALGWDDGGYCFFPMPFRREARVRLVNTTDVEIEATLSLVVRPLAPLPDDVLAFHAEFRAVDAVGDDLYTFADAAGPGKYVGVAATLQGVADLWYLEGNEEISVDGEAKPSIVGTGTEDFFDGGWYWDSGPFALPLHGLGIKEEGTTNRTTPYRIQVPDAIPFAKRLVAKIEHGSSNQVRDAYYSTVAFWYGPPAPVAQMPEEAYAVPRLWVTRPPGAIVASALEWSRTSTPNVATWEAVTPDYAGAPFPVHQAFPVSFFDRTQPYAAPEFVVLDLPQGATASAAFRVAESDRYDVALRVGGTTAGRTFEVSLDGAGAGTIDTHAPSVCPIARPLGAHGLAAGMHTLAIHAPQTSSTVSGSNWFAIDSIVLRPVSPLVHEWWLSPAIAAGPTVEDAPDVERSILAEDFDPAKAGYRELHAAPDNPLEAVAAEDARGNVLRYLVTWVRSPREQIVRARLGSDDGVRVWVNGASAWSHPVHRSLRIDEDVFDVRLKQGWNRVVVKVKNDDGGFGVTLRIADPNLELAVETRRD
jgi:D-arabinan exo alpha-(1,3)/(1,5)-arabinofuranosidase (non-reducing end)